MGTREEREYERYIRFIGVYGEKSARLILGGIDENIWKKASDDLKSKKKKKN